METLDFVSPYACRPRATFAKSLKWRAHSQATSLIYIAFLKTAVTQANLGSIEYKVPVLKEHTGTFFDNKATV